MHAVRHALLVACAALVAAPAPRAQPSTPETPALSLADRRHVRALYLDLLGRTPLPEEQELAASSRPELLAGLLVRTREFWEHWLEDELYFFLLIDNARPADESGADALSARLHDGRASLPDALREIVGGQAFHRANPGNDTFASVVLEQLLGVNVQREEALLNAGRRMYDGQRATLFGQEGDSQADLVDIVLRQPLCLERVAERQYRRVVGREPARADVLAAAQALAGEPAAFPELVRQWVLSAAYARRLGTLRPKTDVQFIRGLSVDLTGRKPGPDELQRLRGALSVMADAAPLRAVIARALIAEHAGLLPGRAGLDAQAFVTETFRRYLGRDPSPDERADFTVVLEQEDCAPATVVQAVVTHWEYQYY
jgi:hypothetical protein